MFLALRTEGFYVDVMTKGQRANKNLADNPFSCRGFNITQLTARKINLKCFARPMNKMHNGLIDPDMMFYILAKLRVSITVGMVPAIFLPKKLLRHTPLSQLTADVIQLRFKIAVTIVDRSPCSPLFNSICIDNGTQRFLIQLKRLDRKSVV